MPHKNPIHEAIERNVVRPALEKRKQAVEGSIMAVHYESQTARVYWRDPNSGREQESENVPLPADGNGLYRTTVEVGDRVTLAFRNGHLGNPYITNIYARSINYESKNGAGIPKGIGFL